MKILLETFFGIVFIGIIIACLPTIMGLFSLCVIAYFIYQAAKSLIEDETEKADAGHDGWEPDSKQDRSAEWQSVQNKQKSETERKQNSYSGYSSSYRSSSYDRYDDYYDDWHDNDMPPEEGDGFRGTGGPFL